jgi:hypothetical protein
MGFIPFSIYIGLYSFYGWTLSVVPNHAKGEIYPLNLHGHIVYLNHAQHLRLEAFQVLAMILFAMFVSTGFILLYRNRRRRASSPPIG